MLLKTCTITGLLLFTLQASATNLLDIVALAKQNDSSIQAQRYQYQAQQQAIPQAKAALLPQINGSADYRFTSAERNDIQSDEDYGQLAIQLSQSIYNKSLQLQVDQAETSVSIEEKTLTNAEQTLLLNAAQRYFNILSAQANVTFTKAQTEAIARQLEQAKQRYDVGLIPITDVHEAQASFDTAVSNDILAENLLAIRWEELVEITQTHPGQLQDLAAPFSLTLHDMQQPVDYWIEQAKQNNPALQLSQLQQQQSRLSIKTAEAGHYPNLSLTSQYVADNSDQDSRAGEIRLQLSVPIYSGGATQSNIKQAQQRLNQVDQQYEQTLRTLMRNVRSAYLNLQAAKSSVTASEQAVKSNESAYKATQAGFDVGTRNIVDVLLSTQNLYRAKQTLAENRYQYLLNYLSLHLACGTLNQDVLENINQKLQ